ncbi:dual specificity tyrosine-phosphorylation-regulated kinase 4-like [Lampetra fluviatilis]
MCCHRAFERERTNMTWSALSHSLRGKAIKSKSPRDILELHGNQLTPCEKREISAMRDIWYFGVHNLAIGRHNHGYDDFERLYASVTHEHINFRYEVLARIARSEDCRVLSCLDHRTNALVAIKMWRKASSPMEDTIQRVELNAMLRYASKGNASGVSAVDCFKFRGHHSIVLKMPRWEAVPPSSLSQYSADLEETEKGSRLSRAGRATRSFLRCSPCCRGAPAPEEPHDNDATFAMAARGRNRVPDTRTLPDNRLPVPGRVRVRVAVCDPGAAGYG